MVEKAKQLLNDKLVLFSAVIVLLVVLMVLVTVFNNKKGDPRSPQGLVAAAFNQRLSVQEWKPGMAKQPFVNYPPAGQLTWRPLPPRSTQR